MSNSPTRAFVCVSHSPLMSLPGADAFGHGYRAAIEDAKVFIADFDPEVVVLFGPDHMNLLTGIRPPFTTVLSGRTQPEFDIPEFDLNVDLGVASAMCEGLLARDVDVAVGEKVAVDHGLGLTLVQLFAKPADIPLVPVVMNAIGYPLVPLGRARAFGAAAGEALAGRPERILFVGTGGLSHNPPFPAPEPGATRLGPEERAESLADAPRFIDPEWDNEVLARLAAADGSWFDALGQADLDPRGSGANELRTWLAAWGAAGRPPATTTAYEAVEKWITGMGVAFGLAASA
ncbi:hypothetical protein ACFQ34_12235 [Pseudonocardia benzenivorans]|uniref:Extradiol ring-cleavage dioxygenase class III enzyme subunit B domain-containing protein n=1 Tax=Pseudonocardia benzenivorans TaxID=228005 RepID=A0ABW3VG06_9PSEU